MIGFLISQRVATLYELSHKYTLEEAYMMQEAVYVPMQNENIAAERASSKR